MIDDDCMWSEHCSHDEQERRGSLWDGVGLVAIIVLLWAAAWMLS